MAEADAEIVCRLKQYRQAAGLSQAHLANLVGVKRQAVYDIETGRYLPNTGVSLRMAKVFNCRVEDLFTEKSSTESRAVAMAGNDPPPDGRVSLAKVRGRLVGHPLTGPYSLCHELRAADGIMEPEGDRVKLLNDDPNLEHTILLMGCDPAFSLLAAHVSRKDPQARVVCRFASSKAAMNALASGLTHVAGTHLHSTPGSDANVLSAREKLSGTGGAVVGFSLMEEGLMVAPGNPLGIRSAADCASKGARIVNRETGAALRVLLDDELLASGIPASAVKGYKNEVHTHNEGAQIVACHAADAALGLRAIACAFGLDFVPITEVRCDLVIPADLVSHQTIQLMLDILQTRGIREEIVKKP